MTIKILLPLDGTPLSLHQVRFAIGLVENGLKAHFVAANIQEPASFYEVITARDPSELPHMVESTAQELMAPAVNLLEQAKVSHEVMMAREDSPVQGMLELIESESCDMVIIGAHDHSLLESGRLRSSAQKLAKVSPVPVLSVPNPPNDGDD